MNSRRSSGGAKRVSRPESKPAPRKSAAKNKHRGAKVSSVGVFTRIYSWFDNHRTTCAQTLIRLLQAWGNSFLTWLVIGIAMALPVGLYVVLLNVEAVAGAWDGNAKVSVYFQQGVSEAESLKIQAELQRHHMVTEVTYLSQSQALEEFNRISGFGDILQSLPGNPLPSLLEVSLNADSAAVDEINQLVDEIQTLRQVESVQLDLHWVQRLQAIIEFARQSVLVLAVLLALAVLLVTGNTIKLAIASRREEIVVIKLVGGTDAFVRRPLLYTGFWYGLGGALVAAVIVEVSTQLLSVPAGKLFGLYGSSLGLETLSLELNLLLIFAGAGLGLLGAWASVAQHLHKIQPK